MVVGSRVGSAGANRTGATASEIPRRRFLQDAAALGGAALLEAFAPMGPVAATAETLRDIDHFIFLMKENRSFDISVVVPHERERHQLMRDTGRYQSQDGRPRGRGDPAGVAPSRAFVGATYRSGLAC